MNWEKVRAVHRMQAYIMAHHHEEITLSDLAKAAAYSPWQALRAFSELTGRTPFAYLREVRLSDAARLLTGGKGSVLDIALRCAFGSHEGFTKAFSRRFGLQPSRYRKLSPPVPLFTRYPATSCKGHLEEEERSMQNQTVFTQVIERPARMLMLKRGVKADGYFAYCEEVGCDVWDVLLGVRGALHECVGLWLPPAMRRPGTSEYCQGVELPIGYAGPVPDGFELIELPPCKYMVFQGEPYDDERFEEAVTAVMEAVDRYEPMHCGWVFAPEDGPRFQLEPRGYRGYIEARPVRALE